MKITFIVVIFFSINSYNYSQTKKNLSLENQIKDQRLKMRNLAFCHCMWKIDSCASLSNDNSAIGYINYMAYDEEIRPDVKLFTSKWVEKNEKNYKSYDDSPLTIMKCLDFYNSDELKKFAIKQDKRIDKYILKKIYEQ